MPTNWALAAEVTGRWAPSAQAFVCTTTAAVRGELSLGRQLHLFLHACFHRRATDAQSQLSRLHCAAGATSLPTRPTVLTASFKLQIRVLLATAPVKSRPQMIVDVIGDRWCAAIMQAGAKKNWFAFRRGLEDCLLQRRIRTNNENRWSFSG